MSVRSGQSITTEFTTRNPYTMAGAVADSLPTGALYVNGTADAASVTITSQAGGKYKAAVTLPTLAVGDVVSLVITATVGGVTDNGKVWEDAKDIVIESDGMAHADVKELGGSATPVTNLGTVFSTDFATNYDATNDRWKVGLADGTITAAVIADNAIDTATFAAGTTIPRVTLADTLTTYTGNTPQTGDCFARLTGTGAVTFASLTVSGATTFTGAITATNASNNLRLGTFTVDTSAIAWNASWDAEVQSEALDALQSIGLDYIFPIRGTVNGAGATTTVFKSNLVSTDIANVPDQILVFHGLTTTLELRGKSSPILSFAASPDGTFTLQEALPAVPATGDVFAIMAASHVHALTAINAEVDTALADYDGPTNAEMVARTLAAASYATSAVCTEARLAELDAGNLPATTDAILADTGTDGVVVAAGSKTGYSLAAAGLDSVIIEASITASANLTDDAGTQLTSINARQAMALNVAALAAVLSGAGTATVTIKQAGKPAGNSRVVATVDADGNRSATVLKVPT